MTQVKALVDCKIAGKKVVVFSKSYCPYCVKVKNVLKKYDLSTDDYDVIEMDQSPYSKDMDAMQDYLKKVTGGRSVPRVFVGGTSVGGCDDTLAADKAGSLRTMIAG